MIRPGLLAALLALPLAAGVSGCNTSNNYFQEEADGTQEQQTTFGAILTMSGVIPKEQRPIEYRSRPPLAMPGSTDLPSPEESSAAEAAVNFPVDEDVQRRAERARLRKPGEALDARTERGDARALPGEISATLDGSTAPKKPINMQDLHGNVSERDRLSREELKMTISSPNRAPILTEDGKAVQRTSLIQPPSDYRTPADTAALPDKGDIENSDWVKKQLYKKDDRTPARMQGQPLGR